jgi:hypothetical protein
MGKFDADQVADETFKQLYVTESFKLKKEEVDARLGILRTRLQGAWAEGLDAGRGRLLLIVALIVVILAVTSGLTFYGLRALETPAVLVTAVAVPAAGLTCDSGYPSFRDEVELLGPQLVATHPIVKDFTERYASQSDPYVDGAFQYQCLVTVSFWPTPATEYVALYLWTAAARTWTHVGADCHGPECEP